MKTAVIYGICAYIALMYFSKGEAIKNILLYGSFVLWIVYSKFNKQTDFLKHPLAQFYFVFLAISVLSVAISIDPSYSLKAMKHELFKGLILFTVIATTFKSEESLKKLIVALSISGTAIMLLAYYSYVTLDITMLKPHITIMHAWHNRFARQVCMTLPFIFILSLIIRAKAPKVLLWGFIIMSIVGLILSTSRAGYVSFVAMTFIWVLILLRNDRNFKKTVALILVGFFLVNATAWISSPTLRARMTGTVGDIKTFNMRTDAWIPIFYAIKTRPLLGWGYGPKLVRRPEPYLGSKYNPPKIGAHNTFLEVTFSSGIIGLISFVGLIGYSIVFCLRNIYHEKRFSLGSLTLLAVLSIVIGNHVLHALLANVSFKALSMLLGISISAASLKS